MRFLWRWTKRLYVAVVVLGVIAAVPVIWVETRCMADGVPDAAASAYQPILGAADRRNEIDTYLTYPEWSIVHAYEDFAGVVRANAESRFRYVESVRGYWSNLCGITRHASARGVITTDVKAMLYIIGVSFSAEMAVKGAYENTIGAVTEGVRGAMRTPEDAFALAIAEDYAKFLRQTPWYEYPFGLTLRRFWTEVPWTGGSWLRKIERRVALSMEYGVKAVYAKAIGALAGLAPAPLRIRSVVRGLDATDLAADARITLVERRDDGTSVVETPRYREFTAILVGLAARGREMVEIAGNDDIFVTLLLPPNPGQDVTGIRLIRVPIQARTGWERHGVAVKISELADLIRSLASGTAELEHVYDY